jgi:TolB protein
MTIEAQKIRDFDNRIKAGMWNVLVAKDDAELEKAADVLQELYQDLETYEMPDDESFSSVQEKGLEIIDRLIALAENPSIATISNASRALEEYNSAWYTLASQMETPPADTSVEIGKGRILLAIDDENWDVYVMDADTMQPVNLTNGEEYDADPDWSPDGEQIVFDSTRDNDDIYVMNADGTQITNITKDKAYDSNPDWSPTEGKIIFASRPNTEDGTTDDSYYDVYITNTDGSGKTNLTANPTNNDIEPVWSPGGKQIAFVSDRDGNNEIYVMNADGTGVIRLTDDEASDGEPVWSPGGEQIAFVSDRDGNDEIYVMNADGTGVIRLTDDEASDEGPVWSPDGVWILFTSNRFFNNDIFATLADGTAGAIRLTDSEKAEVVSDWIP